MDGDMEEIDTFKPGAELIEKGECPVNAASPMACMFCLYAHITECHYPLDCEEACCSHYQRERELDFEEG